MKSITKAKILAIFMSLLFITFGVCLLVYPKLSALTLCYILGILIVLLGILQIIRYFKVEPYNIPFRFDFALGLFGIVAGLILLIHPVDVLVIMQVVIGFYVVIGSVFKLQTSIDMKRVGHRAWWLMLVTAALAAVFGMLLIIDPFSGTMALMIIMGISLILHGLQDLWAVIFISKNFKDFTPIDSE